MKPGTVISIEHLKRAIAAVEKTKKPQNKHIHKSTMAFPNDIQETIFLEFIDGCWYFSDGVVEKTKEG